MKLLTSLLALVLMGCSAIPINYQDPERCARVYAPEAVRIYKNALKGTLQESARVEERVAAHPAPDALVWVIEWTIKEVYRHVEWTGPEVYSSEGLENSSEYFRQEYTRNCEYMLKKNK